MKNTIKRVRKLVGGPAPATAPADWLAAVPPADPGQVFPTVDLPGEHYRSVLARLHEKLRPKTYLEIGVESGATLALAEGRAVAIDPRFALGCEVVGRKPSLFLFQGTSDAFFAAHDPKRLLGGRIELGYIDGMHLFEFALRDLIHVERHAKRSGVIAIHDCVPCDPHIAGREVVAAEQAKSSHPEWWTGDVWKLLPILRHYRPNLQLDMLDAAPTGLLLLRRLDPGSDVLHRAYDDIVATLRDIDLPRYGVDRFRAECGLVSAAAFVDGLAQG